MALNPRRVWCSKQTVLLPYHFIALKDLWLTTELQVWVLCAGILLLCLPKPGFSQASHMGTGRRWNFSLTKHPDFLVHLCGWCAACGFESCRSFWCLCLPEHLRAQVRVPFLSAVCAQIQPLGSFRDICCINRKLGLFYIWNKNQNCIENKRFRYSRPLLSFQFSGWSALGKFPGDGDMAKATSLGEASHPGSQCFSNHRIKLF